jgi:hypothetical protein
MEERSSHITVIVGASTVAEDLRRMLVRRKVSHAGVATHLRGLRKSMALAESDLMIVCIALDQPTINRHGESLRKLLADCHCFPQAVRSVGLLTEVGLTGDTASLGCDVYAHDSAEAARAVRLLANRWSTQKSRRSAAQRRKAFGARPPALRDAWVWGTNQVPAEFAPLLKDEGDLVAGATANAGKSHRSSRGASRIARTTRRRSSPRHDRD